MKRIVIFGATSAIALEAAREWATSNRSLCLVARNGERLGAIAVDLRARGAKEVQLVSADLVATPPQELLATVTGQFGEFDGALLAYGTLSDQALCENDSEALRRELDTNFTSSALLLMKLAQIFERAGGGTIGVITSVAGDRGRQSNYVYGSAKGALSLFCQGLRNRCFKKGVRVVTIKPGFVDTPMTAHFKKGPLWASASAVGAGIVRAMDKGASVVYLPWFWSGIMAIIRSIPETLFKRLSL